MTTTQRARGPKPGKQQAHKRVSYDPSSGQPWRSGVILQPDAAAKAVTAANLAGLSFAGLVNELIRRMDVDETGLPVWVAELRAQEELPEAS